jgi:hypothetical protein
VSPPYLALLPAMLARRGEGWACSTPAVVAATGALAVPVGTPDNDGETGVPDPGTGGTLA